MERDRDRLARMANALRLLACLAAASVVSASLDAQVTDFDAVASRLSASISVSSKGLEIKPSVLVADFSESHGGVNQLGAELAKQLSLLLAKNAKDFAVAERDSKFDAFMNSRLPLRPESGPPPADCSDGQAEPSIVVDGFFDSLDDRVVVRIKATRLEDKKAIFDERISLPLTPELQSLESRPISIRDTAKEDTIWNRPGFTTAESGPEIPPVDAGDKVYTQPRCLDCPAAQYSDSATTAKIQGTVTLRALIDPQGRAARIIVVNGLPCGLNEKAIETVADWKFSPATGSNGKPTAAWVKIQVSFHLAS
jgi:TonB family protein